MAQKGNLQLTASRWPQKAWQGLQVLKPHGWPQKGQAFDQADAGFGPKNGLQTRVLSIQTSSSAEIRASEAQKCLKTRGFDTQAEGKFEKTKIMDGLKTRVLGRFGPKMASRLEF